MINNFLNKNKYLFITYKILKIFIFGYLLNIIYKSFPLLLIPSVAILGYFFALRIDKVKETELVINLITIFFIAVSFSIMLLRGLNILTFELNPFFVMAGGTLGIGIYMAIIVNSKK